MIRDRLAAMKLAAGCVDCGYREHACALAWDHRPGTEKLFALSTGSRRSRASIDAELAKCEVRCANCHAVVTYARQMAPQPAPDAAVGR